MEMKTKKINAGFVLTELLLGIAVVAVIALIGAGVYQSLRANVNADDMADKTIALVSDVQRQWRNAGPYASLSAAEVDKISLVKAPLKMNGTNMVDAWGNTMSLSGSASSFALTIGGSTFPISKEDCSTIANKLSSLASVIRIGADAAAGSGGSAGTVTGGNLFKSGATITQSGLTDGCSATNTVIAAAFR